MKRGDAGLAARLLEAGWLPPRAAAANLGMTPDELDRHIRAGGLRARSVGGLRLVEVPGAIR